MSYKNGMSKTQFKNYMRMFWTEKWRYGRSVEEWVNSLNDKWSGTSLGKDIRQTPYGQRAQDMLFSAIDKLVLEKKIFKIQGENLKTMIKSSDRENAILAIQIMHGLKPKKFKKIPKNTETNE